MRVKAKNTLHWKARKGKTGVEKKILIAGQVGEMDEATAKSFIAAGAAELADATDKEPVEVKTSKGKVASDGDGAKTPETEQQDDKDVL